MDFTNNLYVVQSELTKGKRLVQGPGHVHTFLRMRKIVRFSVTMNLYLAKEMRLNNNNIIIIPTV